MDMNSRPIIWDGIAIHYGEDGEIEGVFEAKMANMSNQTFTGKRIEGVRSVRLKLGAMLNPRADVMLADGWMLTDRPVYSMTWKAREDEQRTGSGEGDDSGSRDRSGVGEDRDRNADGVDAGVD